MKRNAAPCLILSAIAALAALSTCSSTGDDEPPFANSATDGSTHPKTDASEQSPDASLLVEGGLFIDASYVDTTLTKDAACQAVEMKAERLPLDLYFMVDKSGSMSGQKWANQSAALKAFFSDTKNNGMWVGLSFFPSGTSSSSCSGDNYSTPQVPWAELPSAKDKLLKTITSTSANGGSTPTQDALTGLLKGAVARKKAMPLHAVAAVLVSDGQPNGCPKSSASDLKAIAASYAAGATPIKTFAIFVANEATASMTAIAQGGGTGKAFDATGGQTAFSAALEQIRGAALACEYKMPSADGGKIDRDSLTVNFKPTPTSASQAVTRAKDESACGSGLGWYYDDNASPQKIILCPNTCTTMQKSAKGSIEMLLSCESRPL